MQPLNYFINKTSGTATCKGYGRRYFAGTPHNAVVSSSYNGYPVTEIDTAAFFKYRNLESVSFPTSLKFIQYDAFTLCSSLKSIIFPSSLKYIDWSFGECSSLETITLPCTFISIGENGFYEDNMMQHIAVDFGEKDDWLGTAIKIFNTLDHAR